MRSLIAVVFFKGGIIPATKTGLTATPSIPAETSSTGMPVPAMRASLTPLPGQWTDTPESSTGQLTKTPTPTPVQRIIVLTVILTPFTSTPGPETIYTETLTPEADPYLRQVQVKFVAFQAAYVTFSELHKQFGTDSSLLADAQWKIKIAPALSNLESAANQLAAIQLPDPNYAVFASYLDRLAIETGLMATAYRKAINHNDSTYMEIVAIHLQAMNEILNKADQEYKAVKSRLATPAVTQVPASTPTP
jgi:hypothetical protein